MTQTVAVITLGCKVNFTDSESIAYDLKSLGYRVVMGHERAAAAVVNTCTVTGKADYQSRQAVRRMKREIGDGPVIVTGCSVAVYPESIANSGVDTVIVHPQDRADIADIVRNLIGPSDTSDGNDEDVCVSDSSRDIHEDTRTRAFVKVQEGCNARCSYCVVPLARGRERSVPADTVVSRISELSSRGYREVVLTGIHLGRYGDTDSLSLVGLLGRLIEAGFPLRYRLSSLEPLEISDDLLHLMTDTPEITPHLHIPLQSGDDSILKAMKRPYQVDYFEKLVERANTLLDAPGIGIDVMVGFPGEDDNAFENTVSLLKRLPVTYLHVFPFSPRPGTPAFQMSEQVPGRIKKERAKIIRDIGEEKNRLYRQGRVGHTLEVLTERKDGIHLTGKSENYLTVYMDEHADEVNCIVPVTVVDLTEDGVYGRKTVCM
ncbi:MAG: tRNA (N(6)-L-threonylcarbamoyladenosine(37)-C(2))-methylthiotransferase MtaB [Deltaproteobacteria bacterium]|nr:tRNA (N(6)-L-threonylcarbamoyladenosine(37)-C(2))-methylthiotransferase MtaB [Candidatus Zymogenaceae bacterium]